MTSEEIEKGARGADLTPSFLKDRLDDEEESILAAAASEQSDLETSIQESSYAENQLNQRFKGLRSAWWGRERSLFVFNKYSPDRPLSDVEIQRNINGFLLIFSAIIVVALAGTWFFLSLDAIVRWLSQVPNAVGVALSAVLFAACVVGGVRFYAQLHRFRRRMFERQYETYKDGLGIDDLNTRVKEAEAAYRDGLLEKGVLPKLREIINAHEKSSYATKIQDINATGLAETHDPEYEIPTQARENLLELLNSMPGGSVGIAGPRGAGKTTLLRAFCGGTLPDFKDRPVLAVLAPAPAEYLARDFVLHLSSQVIQQVLRKHREVLRRHRGEDVLPDASRSIEPDFSLRNQILGILVPLQRLMLYASLFLIVVGFSLGFFQVWYELNPPAGSFPVQTEANSQPAAATGADAPGSDAKIKAKPAEASDDIRWIYAKLLSALGIKASPFVVWGLFLFIASYAVHFVLRHEGRMRKWRARRTERDERDQLEDLGEEKQLLERAIQWRHDIKLQQSFTSGWSGSLKLPLGFGMGIKEARTFTRHQMSLPDIVAGFRDFLEEATRHYQVFIGIDELDKTGSDEAARRLLNDIKVIFGVERCFFLVSISESAMSNFERRGLPFRDEFDPSFDAVVHVSYLDFQGALRLIRRRVIGMPVVFIGLCHSLTGGLARDLIRVCRSLLAVVDANDADNSIFKICSLLVTQEVALKLWAIEMAMNNANTAAPSTEVLLKIRALKETPGLLKATDIRKAASELEIALNLAVDEAQSTSDTEPSEDLQLLGREILSFLTYCACLLDTFSRCKKEKQVADMLKRDTFERFARVRQTLAVDPNLATRMPVEMEAPVDGRLAARA